MSTQVLEIIGLTGWPTDPRRICRAASSSASRSVGRWSPIRRLLLLDEPFSNLDARLREGMRVEMGQLQRRLGLTTIFVTHDQTEAMMLSDRIFVMNGGRVEQTGTPRDVYEHPASRFVMDFLGRINYLRAHVVRCRSGRAGRSAGDTTAPTWR